MRDVGRYIKVPIAFFNFFPKRLFVLVVGEKWKKKKEGWRS